MLQVKITPTVFRNSAEGQEIIAQGKPFLLDGKVFQGYKGTMSEPQERQCTDEELDAAPDIDGESRAKVMFERNNRRAQRKLANERELADRDKLRISAKRDALELKLLEQRMETLGLGESGAQMVLQPEIPPPMTRELGTATMVANEAATSTASPATDVVAATSTEALTLTCEECPRTFGIGDYRSEKSLRAALRMHGLKHRRDREKAAATG